MKNENEIINPPDPRDFTYTDALFHFTALCERLFDLADAMYGNPVGWKWDYACDVYDRVKVYADTYTERSDFRDLLNGYEWFFDSLRGNDDIKAIEWEEMKGEVDEYISKLKKHLYKGKNKAIEYNSDFMPLIYLVDVTVEALNNKSLELQQKIIPEEVHSMLLRFCLDGNVTLQLKGKKLSVEKPLKLGTNQYNLLK